MLTTAIDPGSRVPAPPARWERATDALAGVLVLAWLARLVPQALSARLQTDECFHAYLARWLAQHHALPVRIDGLYGGFAYFYPPLYHVLGALAFACAGPRGFLLTNVAVVALLLLVVARAAHRQGLPAAARWGVCLCVATPFLALHAVRMYVEALSTLLGVAAVLGLAALLRAPRLRAGAGLGVLAGLAIVAKLSALVLPPLFLLLAAALALRGRGAAARAVALAAGVAALVAAPLLVRNAVLFGSPVYPALGPDVHPLVLRLNERHFTAPATALWADTLACTGAPIVIALLAALAAGAWRRRGGIELGLAAAGAALVVLAPLQALLEPRHLLPVMIAAGALAALALARSLADRPALRRVADVVALAVAAWGLLTLPALRTRADLDESPGMLAAFRAVHALVPAGETILSRETYDTFWYARRPANWPVPFGQRNVPIALFLTADADSVNADLRAHELRWVLLSDEPLPGPFDGADWPQAFVTAVDTLEARGRARTVWESDDARLVRLAP